MSLEQAIHERWGQYGPLVACVPTSKVVTGQAPMRIEEVLPGVGTAVRDFDLPFATINEAGQTGAVRTNSGTAMDTVTVKIDVYVQALGDVNAAITALRDWFGRRQQFDCVQDMKFTGRQKLQEDDGTWHLITTWQVRTLTLATY